MADKIINSPFGPIRIPEPLIHGVQVKAALVTPLLTEIEVKVLGEAETGLVAVASFQLPRDVAGRLVQMLSEALQHPEPGPNVMLAG